MEKEYDPKSEPEGVHEAFKALVEMFVQAPYDLCGDQREFYLPRINKVFAFMGCTFPWAIAMAFEEAKDPWGDPIIPPE